MTNTNLKLRIVKLRCLTFQTLSVKNIPFKIASPKTGDFISYNFTTQVLGDATGIRGV